MSNRDPNDVVGIARLFWNMKIDPRTMLIANLQRDMVRGFTTVSFDLGGTVGVLYTLLGPPGVQAPATIHASAGGVCFGMVLVNRTGATGGTVTIWEGTASARKFVTWMPAGDVQPLGNYVGGDHENPLFKWQQNKTLQIRHNIGNPNNVPVSITMCYWAEDV